MMLDVTSQQAKTHFLSTMLVLKVAPQQQES